MANKSSKKSSYSVSYVNESKPERMSNGYTPTTFDEQWNVDPYVSRYQQQLDESMGRVANWNYDPLQDASYQALARVYGQRGNLAAKNSLADAAALNGGYGSSYAVSAAQQARNQYNQELASMIPQLEQAAYGRAMDTYNMYRGADDTDYNRYRDTVSDSWNQFQHRANMWDANERNRQWAYTQGYNEYRDLMGDWQWAKNWNMDVKQYKDAQKGKSGGGGGGRSGGGYYGGYGGGAGGNTGPDGNTPKATPKVAVKPSSGYGYQATPGGSSSARNWFVPTMEYLKRTK